MNFLVQIFYTIFYQPLFNLLILFSFYMPGHNFGLAIICLTVLIRLLLYPFQEKSIKSQLALQKIQPKLKEIQVKYKDDKEKQAKALMEFYKKEKFNPLSGFALLLLQFPILIALYRLFLRGLDENNFVYLYNFVQRPETISTTFLGIDLTAPSLALAVLVGIVQFLQTKLMMLKDSKGSKRSRNQNMINYFLPAFIVIILLRIPSAVGLYLLVSSILAIIQQEIVKRRIIKKEKQ